MPSFLSRNKSNPAPQNFVMPTDRGAAPPVTGSHLGLQPGETATERSLRLMGIIADLEQQLADMHDLNAKQAAEIKHKDAKLQEALQQMKNAGKELSLARDEFERLRKDLTAAREKYRSSEQENSALMRSLAPLLQQLLNSDTEASEE